jgi:hypothetical protein
VKVRSTPVGWLLILLQLGLGFLTIALAVDEGFARGKVAFADDGWRIGFGAIGAYLTYRAARAFVRTINEATVELSDAQRRVSARLGLLSQLIGAAFLFASYNDWAQDHAVAFDSWTKPVYVAGGIYLILMGGLSRIDGRRMRQLQRERVKRGETISPYLDSSSDE